MIGLSEAPRACLGGMDHKRDFIRTNIHPYLILTPDPPRPSCIRDQRLHRKSITVFLTPGNKVNKLLADSDNTWKS